MKVFIKEYFVYFLLLVLLYFPLFGFLNSLPIMQWDEARVAMNAYEMSNNSNYLVNYSYGAPDMWNTKPPLLTWFQVLFIKIIGFNELAIRLPSALAALATCIVLLCFFKNYIKKSFFYILVILVLISSFGYIDIHGTRTGDYDALLTLFTTIYGLAFFAFSQTNKSKFLYLFFISLSLAVLTKGIAGLLFMPAIFIYSILQKNFISLLKSKHFYFGCLIFLLFACGFYVLREIYNPGYIKAVMENELSGRYLNVIDEHKHGFFYYIQNFINYRYSAWFSFFIVGTLISFVIDNEKIKKIAMFSNLMILTYLLVISLGLTKLKWYDLPLYPYMAIITSVFIYYIYNMFSNLVAIKYNALVVKVLSLVFVFAIFFYPYKLIINKTYKPFVESSVSDLYAASYYLKKNIKYNGNINDHTVFFDGYSTHIDFYITILRDIMGKRVGVLELETVKEEEIDLSNKTIILCQKTTQDFVEKNYYFDTIPDIDKNIKKYKLYGYK